MRVLTTLPRTARAFTTTIPSFKDAAAAATAPAPPSPFKAHLTDFNSLSSSINTHLISSPDTSLPEFAVLDALVSLRAHVEHVLSLNKPGSTSSPTSKSKKLLFTENSADFTGITNLAYELLADPRVFLTIELLSAFVSLQTLTRDPTPIPAVFSIYANKPYVPEGGGAPKTPNHKQAKYAIPTGISEAALDVAIDTRNMETALDIVDTSYAAPAWKRNKMIRQALPVATMAAVSPAVLWIAADQLAAFQDTVEHTLAKKYAFSGLLAYTGFTAFTALLVVGTRNDQMVRVRYIKGTPLRERWLREEERAALDRIAMAWGFEDPHKHGEEVGEEWEMLREVVGRKGMILDDPELLEGMQ
ncbi:Similar to hypothetical protein [Tuber melanosporum Mel28]; acc. no. XP_002836248 [Pyronema omphalodes CBS 100304]|uniref:Uncharacterized protein n=1 Tax=Pyronema omphalodes (strain CBS 100304) TaxID=1076935 RepID=U4LS54_PYROM|nr:Similar to hypothetical protein [Tuber melanosporum Mel28]; acc. no. XP_002836248 [Pyronema omphalodes CBS 100304]